MFLKFLEKRNSFIPLIPEKNMASSIIRPRIYLTSDLHLDHANIIKYCNRPFKNVDEMNSVLINNWNNTISPEDTVYFLGDLAFAKNYRRAMHFLRILNGNKIIIRGNHDNYIKGYHDSVLKYQNRRFYLVHDPREIPSSWKGWSIVGHTHEKEGFINKDRRTINVSVEQTSYKPLTLDEIIEQIERA